MEEKVDPDIGRVVGFQTGDLMYIATIISIDDDADQFTVRTEDGQELTGPFGAVFLDPEKRMDELNEHYESLGDGTFREKPRTPRSNWTPVADPSPGIIAFSAASIVGIAVLFLMVFILFNLSAVLTQIDSANWDEVQGNVIDAREVDDCSGSGVDGDSSCSHYTYVSVAYAYEGQNYTTKDYSVLDDDWAETEGYWLEKASVALYVNPDQPSQAVHVQGWDGVLEGVYVLFFFAGIILGGYLFVFVPVWFVYAKVQRLAGIEAPTPWWHYEKREETGDEAPQEEKFW
tara:strand:+ start:438 stop:1301 length:864 start_codon:yes stop_codon:yes gene_type:complete